MYDNELEQMRHIVEMMRNSIMNMSTELEQLDALSVVVTMHSYVIKLEALDKSISDRLRKVQG